jgi:hypothetical protein
MKTTWAIATIAIYCAAAHPSATIVDAALLRHAPGFALTSPAGQRTGRVWNGRWEGTTVSGNQLVLVLQLEGQRVTGRLIVGKQSANITYGKVVEDAFAITTSPIDGHSVDATGRYLGDAIELTIEGVKKPVTLTRTQ